MWPTSVGKATRLILSSSLSRPDHKVEAKNDQWESINQKINAEHPDDLLLLQCGLKVEHQEQENQNDVAPHEYPERSLCSIKGEREDSPKKTNAKPTGYKTDQEELPGNIGICHEKCPNRYYQNALRQNG